MDLHNQRESIRRTMTFPEAMTGDQPIQRKILFPKAMTEDQHTIRSTLTARQAVAVIPEHERKSYPTGLTDAQWQQIVPLLPPAEPEGRQDGVELREVLDAILYVAGDRYDWRSFPHDLSPMSTVYSYFRQWRLDGTWQKMLDALHLNVNLYKVNYRFIMTWQKMLDALPPEEYEANGHEELPAATPGNAVSGEPVSSGHIPERDDVHDQEFRPFAPFRHALSASKMLTRRQAAVLSTIILGCGLGLLFYAMKQSMIPLTVLLISLVFFAQSIFSLYLMLYSWEHPERLEASRGPCSFLPPQLSFTALLPARHEEAVIYETIKRVWAANYPSDLLEIAVICHIDDTGTIAEAQRAIREIGSSRVRVETFCTPPINKPHGLNVGFQRTSNQVVTIFDAEDDMDSNIFNVVNTVMLEEKVGILQAGVQLMNFRDHWFAIHNCMEYFFWFKSRLHFHAKVGMIPLGGNTVFFRRDLIERIGGWDEHCLTEDAEIGLRLSGLGEPIRVIYDKQHISREETPPTVASFIRQRTRWQQGFLQVLRKGSWLALPRLSQRLLAVFTLSYPFLQAFLTLLWLPAIIAVLWLKLPIVVVMISFLPLYALFLQFLFTVVGAFTFTSAYGFAFPLFMLISMTITFLPYQFLLGISALRAIYRELHQMHNWEKTEHAGAHRKPEIVSFNSQTAIDAATYDQEVAIR